MASAVTYTTACQGKVGYISRGEAKVMLRTAHQAGKVSPGVGRMAVYSCPYCAFFHIGHKPGRRNKMARVNDLKREDPNV